MKQEEKSTEYRNPQLVVQPIKNRTSLTLSSLFPVLDPTLFTEVKIKDLEFNECFKQSKSNVYVPKEIIRTKTHQVFKSKDPAELMLKALKIQRSKQSEAVGYSTPKKRGIED